MSSKRLNDRDGIGSQSSRIRPASITGIGLVTPLGHDVESTFAALLAGRYVTSHASSLLAADARSPRLNQLALQAACEAITDAGWNDRTLRDSHTGLIVSTSKGPIEAWMETPGPWDDSTFGLATLNAQVGAALHFGGGPSLTIASACATGLHAIIRALLMLTFGEADRVLIVAAESSLHPIFTGSFERLGVVSRTGCCRPFDVRRDGFLMSEAAAAICIEKSDARNRYPWIDRCALSADAAHLTAGAADGSQLRRCLVDVIAGRSVDFVHAHGTGTELNDPIELDALIGALTHQYSSRPPLYSHKGALGHSLGAAGLVAAVLSAKMHSVGVIPPNPTTEQPLASTAVHISNQAISAPLRTSILSAAGFGGAVATLALTT